MAFSLVSQMVSDGGSMFWDTAFQTMIESHLAWLRAQPSTIAVAITPGDAYKYEGDFYGLLFAYKVPVQYHWTVMRVNGLSSPVEFDGTQTEIMVPSTEVLARLVQVFSTTYKPFG